MNRKATKMMGLSKLDDIELGKLLRLCGARTCPTQIVLMRHLIDACADSGEMAWPNTEKLANALRVKRQTLHETLRRLAAKGVIEIEKVPHTVTKERLQRVVRIRLDPRQLEQPMLPFGRQATGKVA